MSSSDGAFIAVAVLTLATASGLLLRRRDGQFREPIGAAGERPVSGDLARDPIETMLASLGVTGDTPVTLLQFSSAFCAPCRTTRVLCADVAARVRGVRHVEVDAESHLDAVRALDVWRTPTVLVLDAQMTVRRRASGAPTRAQLVAAVAELLPQSDVATSQLPE